MKKALTLALAVTMLISILMFTSCDVNSIMEMLGGDFGSETTPPASKRYTVTEDENEIPSLVSVVVSVDAAGEIYDAGLITVVINV